MVKNTSDAMLDLEVIPNSTQFCILGYNPWTCALRVRVNASPKKGLANTELAKELEKVFGRSVKIIHGIKSRKKKILIEGISKPQINQILIRHLKT